MAKTHPLTQKPSVHMSGNLVNQELTKSAVVRGKRTSSQSDKSSLNKVALGPNSLGGGIFTGIGDAFANLYDFILKIRGKLVIGDFVVTVFNGCESIFHASFAKINNRE